MSERPTIQYRPGFGPFGRRVAEPLTKKDQAKMFAWQRPGYKAATPKRERKRVWGRTTDDKSPPRIRKLRAAYCDKFIKTGELDADMVFQLRIYAASARGKTDESQRHSSRTQDVLADQQTQTTIGRRDDARDDGVGPNLKVDDGAARLIHDYLRPRQLHPAGEGRAADAGSSVVGDGREVNHG